MFLAYQIHKTIYIYHRSDRDSTIPIQQTTFSHLQPGSTASVVRIAVELGRPAHPVWTRRVSFAVQCLFSLPDCPDLEFASFKSCCVLGHRLHRQSAHLAIMTTCEHEKLSAIFDELGLSQYLDSFLDQGFDSWETIVDIQETDL